MSVTLTGTGGLFKRLGRLFGAMADVTALKGGTATARVLSGASMQTRGTNITADLAEAPALSDYVSAPWGAIDSWRSAQTTLYSAFRSMAEDMVIRQVDLDANLPQRTLTTALTELIRQMRANSDSINASTVAAGDQTAVGTPTGNPVIVLSTKGADGYILQTLFAETLRLKIASDTGTGATARQEPLTVRGQAAADSVYSHLWPGGSASSLSLSLVDAQLDNSSGNKLVNGNFETFSTANYPDNWTALVGVAGTNFFAAGSGDAYTQQNALKITGDGGGTLTGLAQQLNKATSTGAGAGGSPDTLKPLTQYAFCCKVKVSATPAAGVLRASLVDGSNAIINDASATANSVTLALTGVSTSYVTFSGTFRTPAVLPSTYKLRIDLSTAIDNGKSVYIDDLALAEMTPLYSGGPAIAAFAASTNPAAGDAWTIALTNTMGVMAAWMERVFSLRDKGLQLPYSGSPTVADSLVA